MKKAAVLWTGGKDSALALLETQHRYQVDRLVTFVPATSPRFYAHPVELIQAQANCAGLPHQQIVIHDPYETSYRQAIQQLAREGIEVLITGDIDLVNGQPNWIRQCAKGILDVETPLWQRDRIELLNTLLSNRFEVICSLSYKQFFNPALAGRNFDAALVSELTRMNIDACGENGEYHSMVLDAPFFHSRIQLEDVNVLEQEKFHYLSFNHTCHPRAS